LPEIVPTENEPWWTGATPGVPTNIKVHIADNPPLFAWGEYQNALIHGEREYLKKLLYESRALQRHYEWIESLKEKVFLKGVLLNTNLIHEEIGYTWEGGCSGMDNTPRGRKEIPSAERPNNPDMLWIDAICQQALSARTIARLFALVGDIEGEAEWNAKFEEKKTLVNSHYWDKEDKFYYDIDRNDRSFYKVMTTASYWALTAGIASEEQAKAMLAHATDPEELGGDVPLLSLARNDGDFKEKGKYWRGSLWLPNAYATLKGFAEYGFYKEAHEAGYKIFKHMLATYNEYEPHTIWECYSPTAHRPGTQTNDEEIVRPDFCGWSALGPISVYIEYVLGFHTVNAFENRVEWERPNCFKGKTGIKNLRFGDIVTDILAEGDICTVKSNAPNTLVICGKEYAVREGEDVIKL
jgi:glycogen debranching enzyme